MPVPAGVAGRVTTRPRSRCSPGRAGDRGPAGGRLQRHPVLHGPLRGQPRPACTSRWRGSGRCGTSRRHAGRPRGGRLRRVPGRGLGRGAAHGDAGRPVRPRHVPALDRRRPRAGPRRAGPPRATTPTLRDMAVFDAVVNNADRKIGHLLPVADGHLYGCDHGVCFAEEYKLRTVLWQWRGQQLPGRALTALRQAAGRTRRRAAGRRAAGAAVTRRGRRHPAPGGAAAQAPGAPLPAGELARRSLAARLALGPGERPPGTPRWLKAPFLRHWALALRPGGPGTGRSAHLPPRSPRSRRRRRYRSNSRAIASPLASGSSVASCASSSVRT